MVGQDALGGGGLATHGPHLLEIFVVVVYFQPPYGKQPGHHILELRQPALIAAVKDREAGDHFPLFQQAHHHVPLETSPQCQRQ